MSFPGQLARLNKALALERLGGDEELLQELAGLFLGEYPAVLENIRKAIDAQDAPGVERAAHALKGSVGNFGAEQAHRAALELEMSGRSGDLVKAQRLFGVLRAAMAEVHTELCEIAKAR